MTFEQLRPIILFIAGFLNVILVLIFWLKGKTSATLHLGWTSIFSAIYCFSFAIHYFFGPNVFFTRATWSGSLLIPAFLSFVYSFIGETKSFRIKIFFWYLVASAISILAMTTPYMTESIAPLYPFKSEHGILSIPSRIFFVSGLIFGIYHLLKEYFKTIGFKKLQLKYFNLGLSIYAGGGVILAGIIPILYPKFSHMDASAVLTIPTFGFICYAIFNSKLFSIKVILTEILVVAIALIFFIQTILSQSFLEAFFNSFIFIVFVFIGYLLVKSTRKEIERKEEAEKLSEELKQLNKSLEDKVTERTKELQKSYEEIKKRKDKLEKFYNLTVGRELKMVELKKEIEQLKTKQKTYEKDFN